MPACLLISHPILETREEGEEKRKGKGKTKLVLQKRKDVYALKKKEQTEEKTNDDQPKQCMHARAIRSDPSRSIPERKESTKNASIHVQSSLRIFPFSHTGSSIPHSSSVYPVLRNLFGDLDTSGCSQSLLDITVDSELTGLTEKSAIDSRNILRSNLR